MTAAILIGFALGILVGASITHIVIKRDLDVTYQQIRKDYIAVSRFLRDEIRKRDESRSRPAQ